MSTTHAINNVQHSLQALKELISPDKWCDTPLPVIAAPGWWMEELRAEMNIELGFEPDTIHGCTVMRNDDITEPWLIDHDGKRYSILPKWQRAKALPVEGEGA
jgi:hypothetical protein